MVKTLIRCKRGVVKTFLPDILSNIFKLLFKILSFLDSISGGTMNNVHCTYNLK